MRIGTMAVVSVAGILGWGWAASGLPGRPSRYYVIHSVIVPDPIVAFPDPVRAEFETFTYDDEPLTGEAWLRLERHPLMDRRLRPRRVASTAVPITVPGIGLGLDTVDIALPSWAKGPMQVVVDYGRHTDYYQAASFYVVNPGVVLPLPEAGKPCPYEPVLEGPGYHWSGTDETPSLEPKEVVVRTPEEWTGLLGTAGIRVPESWGLGLPPDAPVETRFARPIGVDFEKEMVLAIFKGLTYPDEQYAHLVIRRMRLDPDGVLRCDYAVRRRGLYTFPFLDDFSPFLVVAVPKMEAPVAFRRLR